MNSLTSDIHKSAQQLALAQTEAQTEAAFHAFFRSPLGRQYASNDANRSILTNYLGDTPVTPETITLAVGFIGDHLASSDARSEAKLQREDAQIEHDKLDAQRASQKAMWGMSKEDLRKEIRRQAELKNEPKTVTLVNPVTRIEYTKRELLALSATEIRKILCHNTGQSRGIEYRQAFDRILSNQEGV